MGHRQKRRSMKVHPLQIVISLLALIMVIVHVAWPSVSIDYVTVVLLLIATAPWLGTLFKSLEFPGGWKIEYQDLERTAEKAEDAGLIQSALLRADTPKYSFQLIGTQDPNLALAGLRIELEKRLLDIAESHGLDVKRQSVGALLRILKERGLLSPDESAVLENMVGQLNAAVHGAQVSPAAADWAFTVGPLLLEALDQRVAMQHSSFRDQTWVEVAGPGD